MKERERILDVICAGRPNRPHKLSLLTTVDKVDGRYVMSFALKSFSPPDADAAPGSGVSRRSYSFDCRRCDAAPKYMTPDHWWQMVEDTLAEGRTYIDLGGLSF